MCELSAKLIAWLDHELPEDETAGVEEHLDACAECRARVAGYRQLGSDIEAYCEAALSPVTENRRPIGRRVLVASGGIAAAVLLALLAWTHARRDEPVATVAPTAAAFIASSTAASAAIPVSGNFHGTRNLVKAPAPASIPRTAVRLMRQGSARRTVGNADAHAQTSPRAPQAAVRPGGWFAPEPPIEIEIPADAVFAPGAVPEGMNFRVEMTVAADGTAQVLRVLP